MTVRRPGARLEVNLDTAGPELAALEEDQRVGEVGAEAVAPGAAVVNRALFL